MIFAKRTLHADKLLITFGACVSLFRLALSVGYAKPPHDGNLVDRMKVATTSPHHMIRCRASRNSFRHETKIFSIFLHAAIPSPLRQLTYKVLSKQRRRNVIVVEKANLLKQANTSSTLLGIIQSSEHALHFSRRFVKSKQKTTPGDCTRSLTVRRLIAGLHMYDRRFWSSVG